MGAARYTFEEPGRFPFFFLKGREVLVYDDRVEVFHRGLPEQTLCYEDVAELVWEEEGRGGYILFLGKEEERTGRRVRLLELQVKKKEDYDQLKANYDGFWQENVHDSVGKVSWTQDLAEKLKELRVLKKRYDKGEITKEEYAQLRQGLLVGL